SHAVQPLSTIRRACLPLLTMSLAACSADAPLSPSDGSGGTTIVDIELPAGGTGFSVTTPTSGGPNGVPGPFTIRGSNVRYEDGVGLVVDLSIVNAGDQAHPAPVTFTFVSLLPSGVTVGNADNGETGPGASFTMELADADGQWDAGEETLPRSVQLVVARGVSVGFVARIDVGIAPQLGAIGGLVWNDKDRDGTVDAGEGGMPAVRVVLSREGQAPLESVTDAAGSYRFDGLEAGLWVVTKPARDGTIPTTPTEIHVLLVEDEGGVSDFLVANFGCAAPPTEPRVRIGDRVVVTGHYLPNPDRVVADRIEVGGDDDLRDSRSELRGPVTAISPDLVELSVMGASIDFGIGPVEIDPPNQCGTSFEDLSPGERVRAEVSVPSAPESPLLGRELRCWNGNPEKVTGRVEAILRDDAGTLRGIVVLRIEIVVTEETEWERD
ncbi:MAG: SdrD B-like domain-containing protein, partial [bacterium]